jgi:hypothetical protein
MHSQFAVLARTGCHLSYLRVKGNSDAPLARPHSPTERTTPKNNPRQMRASTKQCCGENSYMGPKRGDNARGGGG